MAFEPDYDPSSLAGTGRHLTPEQLWAWTRFLDAARLLEEVLAQHLSRDHGMVHSDYEVLVRLDGAGGSARMSALARQVVSSPQKLYSTVNRLESRGWLRREPVADDRRGSLARLTEEGRRVLADAAVGHADLIRRFLLDDLSSQEQSRLGDALHRVATHLRRHREEQACSRCDGPADSSADRPVSGSTSSATEGPVDG